MTASSRAAAASPGEDGVLHRHLDDYLRIRRGLGSQLVRPERELRAFLAHLDTHQIEVVTVSEALSWACDPAAGQGPSARSRPHSRVEAIRGFASYLHALDSRHEVPPCGAVPNPARRPHPHIYTPEQIEALLDAGTGLRRYGRAVTFPVLFGLLAVTGMRIGEALALTREHVDFNAGVLTITVGKSRDPRFVPLHPTTTTALERFSAERHQDADRSEQAFFVHSGGRPVRDPDARLAFHQMSAVAGLDGLEPRPRIHDLRHTFAVTTLLGWYRDGQNVAAKLPVLSTYLGHQDPANTYWYFTAIPELMAHAAARLDHGGRSRS